MSKDSNPALGDELPPLATMNVNKQKMLESNTTSDASSISSSEQDATTKVRSVAGQPIRRKLAQKLARLRQRLGRGLRFLRPQKEPEPCSYPSPYTELSFPCPKTRLTTKSPSPRDIYHVAFLLRQLTLPEIAVRILDEAGFHRTQSVHVKFQRPLKIDYPLQPMEPRSTNLLRIGPVPTEIVRNYRQLTVVIDVKYRVNSRFIRRMVDRMWWAPYAVGSPPYKVGEVMMRQDETLEVVKTRKGLSYHMVCLPQGSCVWHADDPTLLDELIAGRLLTVRFEEQLGLDCAITDLRAEVKWKAVRR